MTTITAASSVQDDTAWLRRTHLGLALGILGVLAMAVGMLMTRNEHQPEGYTYQGIGDYVLTASALPQGIGLFLATLGFHRLQHGRDGRLGTVGVWIYGLCLLELVIQCMTGLALGYETIWGPAYPLFSLGLLVGLALLAAGSWNVGLLPRWMLAVWPPLGVIGSFFGLGPIPLVFAGFLVILAVVLTRRVQRA
jgi:hypothetical protein